MASKSAIPRYLLPQYGAIWRTTAVRSSPFAKPLGVVRYAGSAAKGKPTTTAKSTTTTASKTTAAKKVATPKATTTKTTTAAAKTTAPKVTPVKTTATKAPVTKAAAPKTAAVPKAPTPPTPAPAAAPAAPKAAAKPDPSKPFVLEKPEKFNPPSHGTRLPRSTPRHYGGGTTFEEAKAQEKRSYPGLPPPQDSWAHWFLNNRTIHIVITMGTLTSLAVYTFAQRFKATSPYADLVPPLSEFPRHPIDYIGCLFEVLRLHEEHISAQTAERRRRRVEDVAKRNEYRKAHGLEPAGSVASMVADEEAAAAATTTTNDDASPVAAAPVPAVDSAVPATAPAVDGEKKPEHRPINEELGLTEEGKRKKFLGIF